MDTGPLDPTEDGLHLVGAAEGWQEAVAFDFVDKESNIGGIVWLAFHPGEAIAESVLVVFLPDGRSAVARSRRSGLGPRVVEALRETDLAIGDLLLRRVRPLQEWRIEFAGSCEVDSGASAPADEASRVETELIVDLTFSASGRPISALDPQGGRFDQLGSVSGAVRLEGERLSVAGRGLRSQAWGVEAWTPEVRDLPDPSRDSSTSVATRLSAHFGRDDASVIARSMLGDAEEYHGWVWRGGRLTPFEGASVAVNEASTSSRPMVVFSVDDLDDGPNSLEGLVGTTATLRDVDAAMRYTIVVMWVVNGSEDGPPPDEDEMVMTNGVVVRWLQPDVT